MALEQDIKIGVELSSLRKELGKIPGLTEENAKRMVISLERRLKGAEKASKAAAAALKKDQEKAAQAAAKAWEQGLGDVQRGSEKVFGGIVGDLADVGKGIGSLVTMLGPVGGVAAGVGVALAAVGGAGLAAVAGVAALVASTDDLIKATEHLQGLEGFNGISPEAVESVQRANAAMSAVTRVGEQAAAVLGAEFAPSVERVSTLTVAFGLMALDVWNSFAEGTDVAREAVTRLLNFALNPISETLLTTAEITAKFLRLAGKDVPEGLDDWIRKTREQQSGMATLDLGLERVELSLGDYMDRAREVVTVEDQFLRSDSIKEAMEERRKAIESVADLMKQQVAIVRGSFQDERDEAQKLVDKYDGLEAQLRQLADERVRQGDDAARVESELNALLSTLWANRQAEFEALQVKREEAAAASAERERAIVEAAEAAKLAAAQKTAAEMKAANEQYVQAVVGAFSSLSGAISGIVENVIGDTDKMTEAQKQAALVAFRIEQAAALSQVAINTGLAVSKILAIYPPGTPLTPLGIAATGLTIASGVAQAAEIASSPAPAFALGGVTPAGAAAQYGTDHVPVMARPGQAWLTDEGLDAIGGESGLARVNRGEGGPGRIVVENRYKHRVFDRFVQDNISKGGPLHSAINAPRSRGHRRRRI